MGASLWLFIVDRLQKWFATVPCLSVAYNARLGIPLYNMVAQDYD